MKKGRAGEVRRKEGRARNEATDVSLFFLPPWPGGWRRRERGGEGSGCGGEGRWGAQREAAGLAPRAGGGRGSDSPSGASGGGAGGSCGKVGCMRRGRRGWPDCRDTGHHPCQANHRHTERRQESTVPSCALQGRKSSPGLNPQAREAASRLHAGGGLYLALRLQQSGPSDPHRARRGRRRSSRNRGSLAAEQTRDGTIQPRTGLPIGLCGKTGGGSHRGTNLPPSPRRNQPPKAHRLWAGRQTGPGSPAGPSSD